VPGLRGHASARTTLALLARAVELPLRVPSGSDVVLLRVLTTQSSSFAKVQLVSKRTVLVVL